MQPLTMQKDSSGLWSVTTPPLGAEYYSYTFVVDGVPQIDPLNGNVNAATSSTPSSSVLVPGHPPAPWELTQIPHGNLTRHMLTTYIARGLPMNQEPYTVYTPPNYDPKHKGGYPVLYLLHGWSDYGDGWITVGRAQYILDSLISTGSIVPMIVVMPQGYGDYSFVTSGHDTAGMTPRESPTTSRCSQRCSCRRLFPPSSASTPSRKAATTMRSPGFRWAASRPSPLASTRPATSPMWAASAPRLSILTSAK